MAALHSSPSLLLNFRNQTFQPNSPRLKLHSTPNASRIGRRRRLSTSVRAYKVVIEQGDKRTELEVEPDETILEKALDSDLPVPHDCKLGVCMTCPARLVSGNVDQSEGMLSDDVVERGYALLCVSYPRSDCHVKVIPEEELLSLQLATAND
ncbi:UNVERIFIED_CONTAM: Ferredoxin C 1, chloroplastic [Sesamum radiatum]|uniref:Ferredoxin C 1, chloroplastic n=1 Tax=Sesamum radiatum TaxID=300843 RepID=A0AAW2QJF8_SESRA